MTRTEFCNRLRKAGYSVQAAAQARTQGAQNADVTAYEVRAEDGRRITAIVIWEIEPGDCRVFVEPRSSEPNDVISGLRQMLETAA